MSLEFVSKFPSRFHNLWVCMSLCERILHLLQKSYFLGAGARLCFEIWCLHVFLKVLRIRCTSWYPRLPQGLLSQILHHPALCLWREICLRRCHQCIWEDSAFHQGSPEATGTICHFASKWKLEEREQGQGSPTLHLSPAHRLIFGNIPIFLPLYL